MHKITVCGGGNGAQTLIAVAAQQLGCPVDVYAPFGDEAARLQGPIRATGDLQAIGRPRRASADPAEVIPGSDLVALVLPAFAHEPILRQIIPWLDEGAWVGAIPARGGFDFCAVRLLEQNSRQDVRIFGLQTLPWACRVHEYGRHVHVLGTKKAVDAAVRPAAELTRLMPLLGRLLGLPVSPAGNFLALTLANTGQLIHPGIMYGLFAGWDGTPYPAPPTFYHGLTEGAAEVLEGLDREIQSVRAALASHIDLSAVRPLREWLLYSYGDAIADSSTVRTAFLTNRAYTGLTAPMRQLLPNQWIPDLGARYLTEDVPYGLAVSRAIAQLSGAKTPVADRVIAWAGARLERDYLGADSSDARLPQRYGLETLDALITFSLEA